MSRHSCSSPFMYIICRIMHIGNAGCFLHRSGRTRTCDPLLRRQMLYPPELRTRGAANRHADSLLNSIENVVVGRADGTAFGDVEGCFDFAVGSGGNDETGVVAGGPNGKIETSFNIAKSSSDF